MDASARRLEDSQGIRQADPKDHKSLEVTPRSACSAGMSLTLRDSFVVVVISLC